jgi:hypothetical protein
MMASLSAGRSSLLALQARGGIVPRQAEDQCGQLLSVVNEQRLNFTPQIGIGVGQNSTVFARIVEKVLDLTKAICFHKGATGRSNFLCAGGDLRFRAG